MATPVTINYATFPLIYDNLADSIEIISHYVMAHSMKRLQDNSNTLLTLFITLAILVFSAENHADGGEDWVLVKRFEEQLNKAKSGDSDAMYEVGRMYERGRGVSENHPQ